MNRRLRNFRYAVLDDKVNFDLLQVCSSCGQFLDLVKKVPILNIKDIASELILGRWCTNCEEGSFKYSPVRCYNERMDLGVNSLVMRVMNDHHYLQEAYHNPASTNICSCEREENYLAIAFTKQYPFICGHCGKLFTDPLLIQRKTQYAGLHSVQQNIFRDYYAIHWNGDSWVVPDHPIHSWNLKPKERLRVNL